VIYISRFKMRQAIYQELSIAKDRLDRSGVRFLPRTSSFVLRLGFAFDGSRFRGVLFRDAFSGARGGKRGPAATRSPESFPLPLADPRAPSIVSKRNEPAPAHKCVNLCAKRRRFRRPKIIVDHDPAAIVKQVTVTVQIRVHVMSASKINRLTSRLAKH
jgi:hypothetical protein